MELPSIFITGLFAGGLTCLAVQGGLLASSIANNEGEKLEEEAKRTGHILPVASFLITRLVAYTFLGLLLGSLGSVVQLSLEVRIFLQFAVAVFMIGTALNLLNVHPFFRYFVIQPPRFLTKLVKNQSKNKSIFGPALLGAFTVFIPCGATQAMMAYAISTGSPLLGATTMFVFILGTSPLFFLLGYTFKRFGGQANMNFNKIAAMAIIFIALYNLNGTLALSGSNFTLESVFSNEPQKPVTASNTTSQATIYLTQLGYKSDPEVINVKSSSTVKLKLVNQNGAGCIQAFTIPKFRIQRIILVGSSDEITFIAPNTPGPLPFMCSMGMFRGVINVI